MSRSDFLKRAYSSGAGIKVMRSCAKYLFLSFLANLTEKDQQPLTILVAL